MSRNELRRQAKLAEQAQRWEDMMAFMTKLANSLEPSDELSPEERNMLGVSFKHVISQKRSAWRVISSIENSVAGSARELQLTQDFKSSIEKEIEELCVKLVSLLDQKLIPKCKSVDAKVFLYKMRGDYYRYLAEIKAPEIQMDSMKLAEESYDEAHAMCLASSELRASHPIRLSLALNFSVFKNEILKQPKGALDMARDAFEMGMRDLEKIDSDSSHYNDSKFIVQLLRDNIALWSNEEDY